MVTGGAGLEWWDGVFIYWFPVDSWDSGQPGDITEDGSDRYSAAADIITAMPPLLHITQLTYCRGLLSLDIATRQQNHFPEMSPSGASEKLDVGDSWMLEKIEALVFISS